LGRQLKTIKSPSEDGQGHQIRTPLMALKWPIQDHQLPARLMALAVFEGLEKRGFLRLFESFPTKAITHSSHTDFDGLDFLKSQDHQVFVRARARPLAALTWQH
jgi:hypothetical protein